MERSYAVDPNKIASREHQREFLAHTLRHRDPRQLRVTCLPGADIRGAEAREVIEVYDALGIPRQNITGIEADRTAAERLVNAQLGITIYHGTVLDYMRSRPLPQDIISLDYTGHQKHEDEQAMRYLAAYRLLRNGGALLVNHLGMREGKRMKARLLSRTITERFPELITPMIQQYENSIENIAQNPETLEMLRGAISANMIEIMSAGAFAHPTRDGSTTALPRWITHGTLAERARDKAYRKQQETMRNGSGREQLEFFRYAGLLTDEQAEAIRTNEFIGPKLFDDCMIQELHRALRNTTFLNYINEHTREPLLERTAHILFWAAANGYHIGAHERLDYVSNKGAVMKMDHMTFNAQEEFAAVRDLFCINEEEGTITPRTHISRKKALRILKAADETTIRREMPPRERIYAEPRHHELARTQQERLEAMNGIPLTGWDVAELITAGVDARAIARAGANIATWQKVAAFTNRWNKGAYDDPAKLDEIL